MFHTLQDVAQQAAQSYCIPISLAYCTHCAPPQNVFPKRMMKISPDFSTGFRTYISCTQHNNHWHVSCRYTMHVFLHGHIMLSCHHIASASLCLADLKALCLDSSQHEASGQTQNTGVNLKTGQFKDRVVPEQAQERHRTNRHRTDS